MQTAKAFLTNFLKSYVPCVPEGDRLVKFAHAWCNWDKSVGVPFDMFSKYLEHAVRNIYVADKRTQVNKLTPAGAFLPADQNEFLDKVMNEASVKLFAQKYAGGAYYNNFLAWSDGGHREGGARGGRDRAPVRHPEAPGPW